MRWHLVTSAVACVCLLLAGAVVLGEDAASGPRTTIEVREGDSWTKVTLVKKEGRQTLVKYDDGTEEWVGADRIRAAGDTASPSAPAARSSKAGFVAGDKIEFKSGPHWEAGVYERSQRGWHQVSNAERKEFFWIEPWNLRLPGAAYDADGWAHLRRVSAGEAAPLEPPGRPPRITGDPLVLPSVDGKISIAGPITEVNLDGAATPGQPTGKTAPVIPTTKPAMDFGSVTIHPQYRHIDSIVLCYDTPGMALVQFGLFVNDPAEIVRFDTITRRQIDKRILTIAKQRVVGAAEGGKTILTLPNEFNPKILHLWEYSGGKYLLKANYKATADDRSHIAQATLLSPTRALVRDSSDYVYLIDLATNKAIGAVSGRKDVNFHLHPSGKILAVTTSASTVLLLDPNDFSTIAEFTDAAGRGGVSVDPTGAYVAYVATDGAIKIARIADGSTVGSVSVPQGFKGSADLLSPETLVLHHTTMYDTRTGMPIWIYNSPRDTVATALANGQMLFAAVEGDLGLACVASIPETAARNAIKGVSKDSFVVIPGSTVAVDSDFSMFGNEADNARKLVCDAIAAAGLVYSDKPQPLKITLSARALPAEQRQMQRVASQWPQYMGPFGPRTTLGEAETVSVPANLVTVTLASQGVPIWNQEFRYQGGEGMSIKQGQSLQDAMNAAAQIRAASLAMLKVPAYLPKGATPGSAAALGSSELTSRGFIPEAKKGPTPVPTTPGPGIPVRPGNSLPRRLPSGPTA